jgi:acyl-CoA thioester hydrolase
MSSYFSFTQSVYSEDVDQYSIVYHSNYLKYFERARTEWLLANNLNLTSCAQQGHYFVVSNANIDFKKPLKLHDKFIVDCEIQSHTKASLTFKQTIKCLDKKMIFCSAQILLININESGKITRIPNSIKEILT